MCKCSAASRHYTMIPNKTEHEGATLPSPIAISIPILLRFRCQCKGGKRQNTRTASHPGKTMPVGSGQDWGQDKMGHRVVGMYDGFGGFGWQANAKTWGKTLLQFAVKIASHALYFQIMRKVFRLCFPAEEHEWADELGRDCRGITIHPFQVNCSKPNQAKPNRSEPNRRELNWTELPSRTRIRIRIRQKQQQLQYTFVSLPLLCCRLFLPQCSRLSRSTGWLHAGCVKCNFSYLHNCRQQIAQNKVEIFAAVAATTKRQQQQQL